MSDLVERLRAGDPRRDTVILGGVVHDTRCLEAALELIRLRAALEAIAETAGPKRSSAKVWAIAKAALGDE